MNVGSGNLHYSEPLFSVAENTFPLAFVLAYNSREIATGPVRSSLDTPVRPFSRTNGNLVDLDRRHRPTRSLFQNSGTTTAAFFSCSPPMSEPSLH